MGRSKETRQEIMRVTKELILQKGYAQVTMNDVTQATGMSAGGLYYHYRTVEDIVKDILQTETVKVWDSIGKPQNEQELFETVRMYFESEKRELLDYKSSLNWVMSEYYFSIPREQREILLREKHELTAGMFRTVLDSFVKAEKLEELIQSICVELLGLTMFSMTGLLKESVIDSCFEKITAEIEQKIREQRVK